MRKRSKLEEKFEELWAEIAPDFELIPEYRVPPRRFRYDFWIKYTNILIEVMGGTYNRKVRMSHSSGEGQFRDYEKSRYAQMRGWLVLPYDRKQINRKELERLADYVYKISAGVFPGNKLPNTGYRDPRT